MKNLILRGSIILSLILIMSFTVKESAFGTKRIIGAWKYSVPDAPYQYQKGVITFSEIEKKLSGFIMVEGTKLNLDKIVSKKNNLTCEVYIEGENVIFDLTFKEKSFSGTASYSQGDLSITGTKRE